MAKPAPYDANQPTSVLDSELLLKRASGDPLLFRELTGLLRESAPDEMERISAAIKAGDSHGLERAAHSMKGMLQNFFRGRVVACAYGLELMGREARMDGAADALEALRAEYQAHAPKLDEIEKLLP